MDSEQTVRRRKVFYIPGYDPIHPRRYRELYRKEGAAQAAISGYDIALAAKAPGGGAYGWHVTGRMDGAETEADFEVLVWSDIVRDSMGLGFVATYTQLLRTAWAYIGTGALWRLMKLRKGPVIAALYPVVFLLAQLALAVGLGLLAGWGIVAGLRAVLPDVPGLVGGLLRAVALFGIAALVLRWFRVRDGKFFAYYLMHDYAYSAQSRGANPPELEARMAEFGKSIAAALESDVDEVLVVGHSSGAHLGVSILADLIRADLIRADLIRAGRVSDAGQNVGQNVGQGAREELRQGGPVLSFLSLGQVVPMVSFLPEAGRLRADLEYLSQRTELTWVDVTAPGDGCAFALCDPVSVSGVAPERGKRWPLVISAAFTQTLSPERWKALRWRFFRLHFQYLCAFDRVGDYDYFRITAGPIPLGARYDGRQPSASRIERPVNKFTGTGEQVYRQGAT